MPTSKPSRHSGPSIFPAGAAFGRASEDEDWLRLAIGERRMGVEACADTIEENGQNHSAFFQPFRTDADKQSWDPKMRFWGPFFLWTYGILLLSLGPAPSGHRKPAVSRSHRG